MSLIHNLFSISNLGGDKIIIKFFGIKISLKSFYARRMIKQNPYWECKKNNVDITKVPAVKGQLRELQLATFALLKEFDFVCKNNGITYWIDYGTFLGAARHKGFIPWDDDIDVSIMRCDIDKLLDAFNRFENPDIYIETLIGRKLNAYIYKLRHRKCDNVFIDIFLNSPWQEDLTKKEAINLTSEIRKTRKNHFKNLKLESLDEVKKQSDIFEDEFLKKCKNNSRESGNLMLSTTMMLWYKNYFRPKSYIFPLKEISFEGHIFPCPNNANEYLKTIYGDWMEYPKKIDMRHGGYKKFSEVEKENIKKLANLT